MKRHIEIKDKNDNVFYKDNCEYFDQLVNLVEQHPKYYGRFLKTKYSYLMKWFMSLFDADFKCHKLSTYVYLVFTNKTTYPVCEVCGKPVTREVASVFSGYCQHGSTRIRCSYECTKNDPERAAKTKRTCKDKYGVESITQTEHFKQLSKQTKRTKYGDENYNNREKCAETNLKILGVRFPGQCKKCIEKQKQTRKRKYGSETWNNSEQAKHTKFVRYGNKNFNNSEKAKLTCLDRYGVTSVFMLDEHKPKPISKLNIRVFHILNRAKIFFKSEFHILLDDHHSYRSYDIKIGQTLLEIQGDYWHANPKKYKPDDVLHMPKGKIHTAKEIWKKDNIKKQLAVQNGYNVIYLFESDMKLMSDEEILSFIEKHMEVKRRK